MKQKDRDLAESIEILINLLGRLMKSVNRRFFSGKDGPDLTIAQYRVLYILINNGPYKMSELGEFIHTSCGSLTVMIDRLVEKGLVERSFLPEDRRVVMVQITPEGISEYNAFRNDFLSILMNDISKLDDKQKVMMYKSINEIISIITDNFDLKIF
jgi:DNA-binding MarR family transcriptional regulator